MTATEKKGQKKWLHWALLGGLGLALLALMGWGVLSLMNGKTDKPKKQPKISLLPDRPPPPPPPKDERKPEPPKDTKEVKAESPKEPMPQAENEPLKMEGEAGDGPSAFAAGSVSKDYVGGSVGGRMQQGLFSGRLQRYLQDELNRNRKLKQSDYRVSLRVWLTKDGAIQRVELAQSTGSEAIDELLKQTLLQAAAMREAPPENLPQPINIRVTARGGR